MAERNAILLVEDNATDEMLALRGIKACDLACDVVVAHDGVEACNELFSGRREFSLVILDLSLPLRNGFEVLERIRQSDKTRTVPVVMFSSSVEPNDVRRAAELGVNSYVRKETQFPLYDSRLRLLLYYWMAVHHPCAGASKAGLS